MSIYRNSRCPNCGAPLEIMKRTGWNDFESAVGQPINYCPYCNKPYKTRMNYWHNLSQLKKFNIIMKVAFTVLYQSLAATSLVTFIIPLIVSEITNILFSYSFNNQLMNYYKSNVWVLILVLSLVLIYTLIFNINKFYELKSQQ